MAYAREGSWKPSVESRLVFKYLRYVPQSAGMAAFSDGADPIEFFGKVADRTVI
jgi:hypothetical protein